MENKATEPGRCIGCGKDIDKSQNISGMCKDCFTNMKVSLKIKDPNKITEMVQKIFNCFVTDVSEAFDKDPAAKNIIEVLTAYPGIKAVLIYRVAHLLWEMGLPFVPRYLSSIAKQITGIDIHPGADIGDHFFIDHGEGVVIGETTVIGDNVTLYQGVTLGGVSLEVKKRHPTLGNNIVVGAGAKILGPVKIGDNVKVGANSVIVDDIPPDSVVVGIPARIINKKSVSKEIKDLSHNILPDPVKDYLLNLENRLETIEKQFGIQPNTNKEPELNKIKKIENKDDEE